MPRKQKKIAVIDSETDPFKYGRIPQPFCWGFYDGATYVYFWGDDANDQLVDYLSTETELIVYAHNGGNFDFFYLLPYLDEELMMINGRIARATLFNGAIELRDSYLILPLPLASYQKDVFDYTWLERECRERYKNEILAYLRNDCFYLYEWLGRFIDQFGMNLTLASTAFNELKKTVYRVTNTYEVFDTKFRSFYFGGRVQCFKTGSYYGNYQYVDINSAYPHAMMSDHWYGGDYIEHLKLPDTENGSWLADIEAISHGALPYRGDDDKLYFPVDETPRRYCVTGWEIQAGLDTNTLIVTKVHRTYRPLYTECFSEYVNRFFEMKKNATDDTERNFAKLLLNSCYGKFGQDGRRFEKFAICEFGQWPEGEGWDVYADTPTGQRIFSQPDPQDRFFNVATAASITGYVRAHLWRALCECDEPLYCDTDSVICRRFSGCMGSALGEWAVEAEPVEIHIAQRKMYALKMRDGTTKTASKGVRLNFDEIKEGVVTGKNITQYRDAPAFSLRFGARFFSREVDFGSVRQSN